VQALDDSPEFIISEASKTALIPPDRSGKASVSGPAAAIDAADISEGFDHFWHGKRILAAPSEESLRTTLVNTGAFP